MTVIISMYELFELDEYKYKSSIQIQLLRMLK